MGPGQGGCHEFAPGREVSGARRIAWRRGDSRPDITVGYVLGLGASFHESDATIEAFEKKLDSEDLEEAVQSTCPRIEPGVG